MRVTKHASAATSTNIQHLCSTRISHLTLLIAIIICALYKDNLHLGTCIISWCDTTNKSTSEIKGDNAKALVMRQWILPPYENSVAIDAIQLPLLLAMRGYMGVERRWGACCSGWLRRVSSGKQGDLCIVAICERNWALQPIRLHTYLEF